MQTQRRQVKCTSLMEVCILALLTWRYSWTCPLLTTIHRHWVTGNTLSNVVEMSGSYNISLSLSDCRLLALIMHSQQSRRRVCWCVLAPVLPHWRPTLHHNSHIFYCPRRKVSRRRPFSLLQLLYWPSSLSFPLRFAFVSFSFSLTSRLDHPPHFWRTLRYCRTVSIAGQSREGNLLFFLLIYVFFSLRLVSTKYRSIKIHVSFDQIVEFLKNCLKRHVIKYQNPQLL